MQKKRILAVLFLPLILASFLQSQSLADMAKKEKARRAALKGKHATVITTADLAKSTRRPAVESSGQEQTAEEAVEGQAQEGVTPPATGEQAAGAAAEEAAPPEEPTAPSAQDIQKKQNELAETAQQKAEMVDLLTIKMNALYQEFYGLDNLKSRELVQLQISDTYDKLLKAEGESAKAKKDLEDFLAQAKKDQSPSIWIK
ncbi:MAG: hypothetical protein EHM31_02535 [Candidatus Aminicenantes bacterium]|nr:MAG: hypothetical protein EHM31_02535 [Candidatus Aminicenantes bacterium]